jgi:hypothetical protein
MVPQYNPLPHFSLYESKRHESQKEIERIRPGTMQWDNSCGINVHPPALSTAARRGPNTSTSTRGASSTMGKQGRQPLQGLALHHSVNGGLGHHQRCLAPHQGLGVGAVHVLVLVPALISIASGLCEHKHSDIRGTRGARSGV